MPISKNSEKKGASRLFCQLSKYPAKYLLFSWLIKWCSVSNNSLGVCFAFYVHAHECIMGNQGNTGGGGGGGREFKGLHGARGALLLNYKKYSTYGR